MKLRYNNKIQTLVIQNKEIMIFPDEAPIYYYAASLWEKNAKENVRKKGRFNVAVSGGNTSVLFFKLLSSFIPERLFWNETHIFLVDERMVPITHPYSNMRMIQSTLGHASGFKPENLHGPSRLFPSPEMAAQAYEEKIKSYFSATSGGPPFFDLLVLGLGRGGHVASLFPGRKELEEKSRWVVEVPAKDHDRVTFTLPVLCRAKKAVFLVTGKKKAGILKKIVNREPPLLPAARVAPLEGPVLFLADAEAGRKLQAPR